MQKCLSSSEIIRHLDGSLPAQQQQAIVQHLEKCSVCQEEIQEHQLNEDLFGDLVNAVKSNPAQWNQGRFQTDAEFNKVLQGRGYRIVSELHRGGQGIVFAAIQIANDRQVAVKRLIAQGPLQDEQISRFEREIEVATRLSHPNIVTVFDNGTVDHYPYLVMEFIDGLPLHRYVHQHIQNQNDHASYSTDALESILRLYSKVCSAVSYAHRLGVIHRDLKPTNIMVDQFGEPKILDFGLAKYIESPIQQLTQTGQFLGTLAYASPEQVQSQLATDTRSDVYSLGVILYELITGELPYSVDVGLSNAINNIIHRQPKKLRQIIPGLDDDVETIVLKALAKEPDSRYQSVDQLGDDIQHFLHDRPIEAKRDRNLYVLIKTLQRLKGLVAAAGTVLLSIMVALIVSLWFWNQAVEQRNLATSAKTNESIAREQAEIQSYIANIVAAKVAVLGNDVAEAKRRLDAAPKQFRGWEWEHFRFRVDRSVATIQIHDLYIVDFELMPDGDQVVSVAGDNTLKIWSLKDHTVRKERRFEVAVNGLAVSPDGDLICVNVDGRQIQILDSNTLKLRQQLQCEQMISRVQFASQDDICFLRKHGASGEKSVYVWKWLDNRSTQLDIPIEQIADISANPDKRSIAISGSQSGVYDLDASDFKSFELQEKTVHARFLRRTDKVAFTTGYREAIVFDISRNRIILRLTGHESRVSDVIRVNKQTIATASNDRTIRIWNSRTGELVSTLRGHDQPVQSLALIDDQQIISTSADSTFKIWDSDIQNQPVHLREHSAPIRDIEFNNARGIVASCGEDGRVILRKVAAWKVDRILQHEEAVFAICFSPDGQWLATAGDESFIRIWDLDKGTFSKLKGHEDRVHCVDFSPDGQQVISGSRDQTVRIWDLDSGECTHVMRDHQECVHACVWHSNLKLCATRSHFDIKVWDVDGFDELFQFQQRISPEDYSLAFDPIRPHLAAGSSIAGYGRGYVNLVDLESRESFNTLEQHNSPVNAVVYFPDGNRAVSASKDSIKIWDMNNFVELASLDSIDAVPYSVAVSPDSTAVVAGFDSGEMMVWQSK